MATLSFKNVNKVYPNKVQAVFDFNLEVKDKEFIVFVGPSGCGKSTTLRMIAGFEEITDGEIWIDDKCVNTMAPKDRDIAMVFQNYALYPHMTVFENMAFALKLRKIWMPVVEVDDQSKEYQAKKAEIIASKQQELEEGIVSLKAEKAPKEKIKEFKFRISNEAKSALVKLEEEYSTPVMSFDRQKVKELEKQISEARKNPDSSEEEIANLEKELQEVLDKNDTPLYAFRHYKNKEIADRVMEVADILGLIPYLKRKPAALSGGQRQRVALGRAIVRNPKVFLMDEPLSNLDAKLRVQMRTEIAKLHQRLGTTFIYVTHDQVEAMTLGTRIVVMKDGVIQQVDSPQNLYEKPANLFVAGFIGSPQMNFIKSKVKKLKDSIYLQVGNYEIILPNNKAKALEDKNYIDKEVIMGIRPEDIYIGTEKDYEGKLNVYELLGAEVFLYFDMNNEPVVARVEPSVRLKPDDKFYYNFDIEKIHIFDSETEITITN